MIKKSESGKTDSIEKLPFQRVEISRGQWTKTPPTVLSNKTSSNTRENPPADHKLVRFALSLAVRCVCVCVDV